MKETMENIRVVVRVRPFLPKERARKCVTVHDKQIRVGDDRTFAFDKVFDMDAKSENVNSFIGDPLISAFVNGYTASTIAYGQTGAGKTYTMSRLSQYVVQRAHEMLQRSATERSCMPLQADELAPPMDTEGTMSQLKFYFSAVEIYNDQITDLSVSASASSSSRPGASLTLREDTRYGVFIEGLSEVTVDSSDRLVALIEKCMSSRRTAVTQVNETSSRSHCLLTVTVNHGGLVGRFALVDLAGSERIKKSHIQQTNTASGGQTEMTALRIKEGISINGALLALGNVISALCARKSHVPYRASKLTRLLQPMLSGNSKTTMIACVSPVATSFDETLNTLKYANRVKSLRTIPMQDVAVSSLDDAQRANAALRQQLLEVKQRGAERPPFAPSCPNGDMSSRLEELEEKLRVEQNLTRRLQDDLFTAEYTTMVEVEKRKSLEKRVALLEHLQKGQYESQILTGVENASAGDSAASCPVRSVGPSELSEESGDVDNRAGLLQQLETGSERLTELGVNEQSTVQVDTALREDLLREITQKEQLIKQLKQENEEVVWALEDSRRKQEEAICVKLRLEEALASAVLKLEATEMEQQRQQTERSESLERYKEQLSKAEDEVARYRRKVEGASPQVNKHRCNDKLIQQLQAQIPELREKLSRQTAAVCEGHRREQKLVASYTQTVKKLKRQIRKTESQVSRLQMELQKRDRENIRVKPHVADRFDRCRSTAHMERKYLLQSVQRDPSSRAASVQREIDLELRALATIEKDLDDLMLERCEAQAALDDSSRLPSTTAADGVDTLSERTASPLPRCSARIHAAAYCEGLRSPSAGVDPCVVKPLMLHSLRRLEEVEDCIDSLQEARKYHLRRVRRLQKGLTSLNGSAVPRASELVQESPNDVGDKVS